MIEYRSGCLIKALKSGEVNVIGHQANCFNTMGSGVAKAIREVFPEAYEADCQTDRGDKEKLGGLTVAVNQYGMIFNLYGQYDYGRDPTRVYTQLDALYNALRSMHEILKMCGYQGNIGFPKLGCGLGGAKWEQVEAVIEGIFTNEDMHVVVYEKEVV
ncbi:Macro domain protein [compost metagenome]